MELHEFLYLSQEDVVASGGLDFESTIADVIKAYSLLDQGEAKNPVGPSMVFDDESGERFISIHAAWLGDDLNVAGVKVVTRAPRNPFERNLPSIVALMTLVDPETGLPIAVLDGTAITAVRTGAATAVGAKYLGRADAETVAIIGAGVMARAQVLALTHVLPNLREIRVFDVAAGRAAAWATDVAQGTGLRIRAVASPREAVEGADIVAPATTVSMADAYIQPAWIKPGAFLANVSDNDYTFDVVLGADKVVIDGPKQFGLPVTMGEMKRAGLLDRKRVVTIGQVINGKEPGREHDREICFFSAMGLGVQDVICAHRVVQSARKKALGRSLRLWDTPHSV